MRELKRGRYRESKRRRVTGLSDAEQYAVALDTSSTAPTAWKKEQGDKK